jgi:hypothetical protein
LKVYKSNNKYIVYLPFDVIKQLGIKDDEEVDFVKYREGSFIFAKKADLPKPAAPAAPQALRQSTGPSARLDISPDEIAVLKKLDTFRYTERTTTNVAKILGDPEKRLLEGLIKKQSVMLFKDKKDSVYSISKDVYDRFLMRKKAFIVPAAPAAKPVESTKSQVIPYKKLAGMQNENIERLEKDGFLVLSTESEASAVSLALEDSVRHGLVLGTRAFNKKFYIILRDFFNNNSGKVLKSLREGPKSVEELEKDTGMDGDAIRAMLYLLAEQGDASERRRDVFALV